MSRGPSASTKCFALQNMTILDNFSDDDWKMLPNVIFFHYGDGSFKVAETATGPVQS